MACFRRALKEYGSYLSDGGSLLFLNFHPDVLARYCDEILFELGSFREKTVIEVTEAHSKIRYISGCLYRLKEEGVRIALDDIGAGDRSLVNICEMRVDYLKVDRAIIHGLTKIKSGDAEYFRLLLRFLARLGLLSGSCVIAEGVETANQLSETVKSGVDLMQGFYFSRPKPASFWSTWNWQAVKRS